MEKILYLSPYPVFLISIKNSGVFFAVFILCLAWYYTRNQKTGKPTRAFTLLSPFLTLLLWKRHVDLVFVDGMMSKHSMSISNFSSIIEDKSLEDISIILSKILQRTLTLSNPGIHLLIAGLVLWGLWKYVYRISDNAMKHILILTIAAYIVYQVGMIAMYVFSMPRSEAGSLAGYGRYHKTILTFMAGLLLLEVLLGLQYANGRHWQQLFLSAFVLVILFHTIDPSFSYLRKQKLSGTEREKFDYLVEGYGIYPEARYAIVVSSERDDSGYLFLTGYSLSPQSFSILPDTSLETADWDAYDYILVFEKTEHTQAYLAEYFPDVTESVVYLDLYRHQY